MQKWEYLQVHVQAARGGLTAAVHGNKGTTSHEFEAETEFMRYINTLGAEGWELVNADKNEYGFQNYFFKRPLA